MEELLSLEEASKMLGVKPATLRKWDNEGRLNAIRIGSRRDRRYKKSQIDKIISHSTEAVYDIQELDGAMHSFFGYIESFIGGLKENYGRGMSRHLLVSENGHVKVAYSYEELMELGEFISKRLLEDPIFAEKIVAECNYCFEQSDLLIKECRQEKRSLLEFLEKTEAIYKKGLSWSMLIEPLDAFLLKAIKNKITLDAQEATSIFGILSTPLAESFVMRQQKAIAQLAQLISKDAALLCIFKDLSAEDIENKIKGSEIEKKINEVCREFYWWKADYIRYIPLTALDVIAYVQEKLSKGTDLSKEIYKLDHYLEELKKAKASAIERICPDEELTHWLWIINAIGPLHDARKEWFLKMQAVFEMILDEISALRNISQDILRYCSPTELRSLVMGEEIDLESISRREKYCVMISDIEGHTIIYGGEAKKIEEEELGFGKNELVNLVKGTAVSFGTVSGRARVVYSSEEARQKIKPGDILVTSMTRPDFVPFMEIAAAIVTNEGGITCHAAILSRELQIPCVVGTRIATRVINDGDIIEVNGTHGIIYILERAVK